MAEHGSRDTTPALTRAIQALQRGIMRSKPSADNGDYAIVGFLTLNEAEAILSALATPSPQAPQEPREVHYECGCSYMGHLASASCPGHPSMPAVAPAVPDHAGLLDRIDVLEHALRSIVEFDSVDIAVTNTAIRALRPPGGETHE